MSGRQRAQFFVHLTANTKLANKVGGAIITSDGMGRVSTIFLCSIGNGTHVGTQYIECPIGTLEEHKFITHAMNRNNVNKLPDKMTAGDL